jgi:hypothetical protein
MIYKRVFEAKNYLDFVSIHELQNFSNEFLLFKNVFDTIIKELIEFP